MCGQVHHCLMTPRVTPVLVCHFADTNGKVFNRNVFFNTVFASIDLLYVSDPSWSKMITSGLVANTHGQKGYEFNSTNNQHFGFVDGK